MASEKQIHANRRDAWHGAGPKSSKGMAAVRLNAPKHGLTSQNAGILRRREQTLNLFLNAISDHLQPPASNPTLPPPLHSIQSNRSG